MHPPSMVFCFSSRWSALKVLLTLYVLWFTIFISGVEPTYLNHTCPITTTYTPNSTYQINLNSLLSTLSSPNITGNNLFYNATAGNSAPDRVYGLFMCRGDVTIYTCRDCVANAAREIVERCPEQKEAYIWYDECMLRYDNKSIFSIMEEDPKVYMRHNERFTDSYISQILGVAMDNLAARASSDQSGNGGQLKGFATGETHFSSSVTLYSLVQCTPDLSGNDCNWCLRVIIGALTACCRRSKGVKFLLPSCNIRFETYRFYNKTAAPPTLSPPASSSSASPGGKGRIIAIVVAVVVSIFLFILGFCFLRRRAKKATGVDGNEILIAESLQYDLTTIGTATNNFSAENKVGEGGFGDVFKGILLSGQAIAVKRLSRTSGQGEEEFKNEVSLVAKLQHRNLVRLIGFCLEREEKILIYEFVPNKSLDYFLFDPEKSQLLNWSSRYKIIGGITQGILYLHEHSRLRIIHRDLKASNVLLDEDMNAKISDFGMAKTFGIDQSQAKTNRIVGTYGYMAPEYAMHGKFSVKSDVFSFGVLILEIISGQKNNNFYQLESSEDLLSHAWKCWKDGTALDLVDTTLGDSIVENEVIRCIHIGLLCVQEDPDERPTMTSVVLMLNTYSFPLPLPHHPAFFLPNRREAMLKQLELDSKSKFSANEISISELYPR